MARTSSIVSGMPSIGLIIGGNTFKRVWNPSIKASIRALNANDPALLDEAERLSAQADASNDYAEGRAAFAEKRAPRFTGR